ncbi:hypothetical protein BJX76DRAFT_302548 [Aspergillus varians]
MGVYRGLQLFNRHPLSVYSGIIGTSGRKPPASLPPMRGCLPPGGQSATWEVSARHKSDIKPECLGAGGPPLPTPVCGTASKLHLRIFGPTTGPGALDRLDSFKFPNRTRAHCPLRPPPKSLAVFSGGAIPYPRDLTCFLEVLCLSASLAVSARS